MLAFGPNGKSGLKLEGLQEKQGPRVRALSSGARLSLDNVSFNSLAHSSHRQSSANCRK
jgi:hypothetical protein